jgi:hypothetical protein
MSVENPTATQLLVAWRDNRWVVSRDNIEIGAYAYRTHAMDQIRALAALEAAAGRRCYMLIREKDGSWSEHPCPKPPRPRVAPDPAKD